MPYVSVVVPAYNAADFIVDAYRSVVDQTIDDWEIIFVNDASQDNTLAVLQSFSAADKRVKIIDFATNSGPGAARNAALAVAAGDWVAMLDADDRYGSDRLEVLTRFGEQASADIVLDNQFVLDPILRRVAFLAFEPPKEEVTALEFSDYLRHTQSNSFYDFGYLKPVIKRTWLTTNNLKYQEQLRLGEDLMLLYECYASRGKVILISEPHYHYTFQYSHISRTVSPTTKTEASCEPLAAAVEKFLEKRGARQSRLERRLIASACESLHERVIAAAFRDYAHAFDVIGMIRCLRRPIRLFRGIYFEKRRSRLFERQARIMIPGAGDGRIRHGQNA
jgi:succinoglycan biosynthesis protein ExoO